MHCVHVRKGLLKCGFLFNGEVEIEELFHFLLHLLGLGNGKFQKSLQLLQ